MKSIRGTWNVILYFWKLSGGWQWLISGGTWEAVLSETFFSRFSKQLKLAMWKTRQISRERENYSIEMVTLCYSLTWILKYNITWKACRKISGQKPSESLIYLPLQYILPVYWIYRSLTFSWMLCSIKIYLLFVF